MLDSHARKLVQPVFDGIAKRCLKLGISANALTMIGMLVGVGAAGLVASGNLLSGVAVLWLSGVIDAADGTLARMTQPSPLGAILDITFDRVVEVAMIVALASRFPDANFELLILAGTIAIAMSLFLSIGAAVSNRSVKAFHYAPGLGERTEAFICLSLMALDSSRLLFWTWFFITVIALTMAQRLIHAQRLLSSSDGSES